MSSATSPAILDDVVAEEIRLLAYRHYLTHVARLEEACEDALALGVGVLLKVAPDGTQTAEPSPAVPPNQIYVIHTDEGTR